MRYPKTKEFIYTGRGNPPPGVLTTGPPLPIAYLLPAKLPRNPAFTKAPPKSSR